MTLTDASSRSPSESIAQPGWLFDRGLEHHQAGCFAEASQFYRLALAAQPDHPDSLHLLGMIAFQAGDLETATASIRRAIAIHPHAASYHANLGNVLQKQGLAQDAARCYLQALRIDASLAPVHANLASVFLEAGQPEVAVTWYHRALALDPAMAVAHRQLGDALRQLRKLEEAASAYEQAIALKPDDAESYNWAGRVLREMGDLPAALEKFRHAQIIEPAHPRAGFGEAMVQLLQGDYESGWRSYERRWTSSDHATPNRAYARPRWNGEPLESGKLLLWPEQGVGDEIMFAGLLPDLLRTGTRCVLACDARLQPLFARSFPDLKVIADAPPKEGETPSLPPDITAQLPIGSLPGLFRQSRAAFQTTSHPYLIPDRVRRNALRERYSDGRRLIGLSWFSNNLRTGTGRSIDLPTLAPLFAQPATRWISLQYGEHSALTNAAGAAGLPLLFDPEIDQLNDMDAYAAQVAAMDLVITIDNTSAHMAGALGIPVWLLLPFGPDWRWQATGSTTPWYPGMRLFRQPRRGDWQTVMEEVREALIATP